MHPFGSLDYRNFFEAIPLVFSAEKVKVIEEPFFEPAFPVLLDEDNIHFKGISAKHFAKNSR